MNRKSSVDEEKVFDHDREYFSVDNHNSSHVQRQNTNDYQTQDFNQGKRKWSIENEWVSNVNSNNNNCNNNDDNNALLPPPAKKLRTLVIRPNQSNVEPKISTQPETPTSPLIQSQSMHQLHDLQPHDPKPRSPSPAQSLTKQLIHKPPKPPKPMKPPKPAKPMKHAKPANMFTSGTNTEVQSNEVAAKTNSNHGRHWKRSEKINLLYLCYNVLLTKRIDYQFYIPNVHQHMAGGNDSRSDSISDTNFEKYNQFMQNIDDDDWDDIELYFDQCTIDDSQQLLKDLFTIDTNFSLHNAAIIRLLQQKDKLNYQNYIVDCHDGDDLRQYIRKFTRLKLNFEGMMKDKDGVCHQLSDPSYCEMENEFVQAIVRFLLKLPIERLHCCTVHNIKQAFVINRHKTIQDYIGIKMGEFLRRMKMCDIIVTFGPISAHNIRKSVQLRYTFVQQFVDFLATQNDVNTNSTDSL